MKGVTNGQLHHDRRSSSDAVRDSGDDGGLCSLPGDGHRHLGVRFCTSCQADRDVAGGEFRKFRNTGRWVCQCCIQRKTVSIYKSQGKTNEKALRQLAAKIWGAA